MTSEQIIPAATEEGPRQPQAEKTAELDAAMCENPEEAERAEVPVNGRTVASSAVG